jgi:hypothetical protein
MLKHVEKALEEAKLVGKPFTNWTPQDTMEFSHQLLPVAKPTMIIANKMDLPTAEENLEKLQEYYINGLVAASSAEAELALRRADQSGLIKYTPGEEGFRVLKPDELTLEQQKAIDYIEERVIHKYMRTGIQQALNTLAFKVMKNNMIYPVSDDSNYADGDGNVLPDVYLMPDDATPRDLAKEIHTSIAERYMLAIDAKTGLRLPKDYTMRHRDVIKIMTRKRS